MVQIGECGGMGSIGQDEDHVESGGQVAETSGSPEVEPRKRDCAPGVCTFVRIALWGDLQLP